MEAIIIFVKYLIIFAVSYYVVTFLTRLFRKPTYRIIMTDSQTNSQLYLLAIAADGSKFETTTQAENALTFTDMIVAKRFLAKLPTTSKPQLQVQRIFGWQNVSD